MGKNKLKNHYTTAQGNIIGIFWVIGAITAIFGNVSATVFWLLSAMLIAITCWETKSE